MARENPPVNEPEDGDIEVRKPKDWAAGMPGVLHSMIPAIEHMGIGRTRKTLLSMNHKDGFDCMSCAWPDPDHRKAFEFCENGAKAVTWEATPVVVPSGFWAEHPVDDLLTRSEYWLGMQGRLTEPVYKSAGDDHYRPVTWDEAFSIVGNKLNGLQSPNEAAFYTSGRASNEAAFAYQLFVRGYGTNNLPDCSNMCHESSGWAMGHHRHRQGHNRLRRFRQGRSNHHHGTKPWHEPSTHAHRAGGSKGQRRGNCRRQPDAGGRSQKV